MRLSSIISLSYLETPVIQIPKVSIIWLNYNSMGFISIAKKGLESISQVDLPIELILVDNCSTDGSFKVLVEYVKNLDMKNIKILRLRKNLGFTGGNNVGYRYVSPKSKYIALINNDCIIEPKSLKILVNFLERHEKVGAVQGVIYNIAGNTIDNAGFMCSETLLCIPLKEVPEQPRQVTYISGAYMVLRRAAIERIGKLFDWEGFMYFDDLPLGYRMWMHGFKVMVLPITAGRHLGSASGGIKSPETVYYMYRGLGMFIELSNSRFRRILKATALRSIPIRYGMRVPSLISASLKGLLDGFKLGSIKRRRGEILDIYAAPMLKRSAITKFLEIVMPPPLIMR